MNSPLQLKEYVLTGIALQPSKEENPSRNFRVSARPQIAQNDKDPLDWMIQLDVQIRDASETEKAPYSGEVGFLGRFRLLEAVPEDRRLAIISSHGASILYGAAREVISNLTARGPHGMVTLPSLSFVPPKQGAPPDSTPGFLKGEGNREKKKVHARARRGKAS